jgi:hypothetical protein
MSETSTVVNADAVLLEKLLRSLKETNRDWGINKMAKYIDAHHSTEFKEFKKEGSVGKCKSVSKRHEYLFHTLSPLTPTPSLPHLVGVQEAWTLRFRLPTRHLMFRLLNLYWQQRRVLHKRRQL